MSEVWASLIGFAGVCLTVMGTVYIWRKTSQQTEKANHQTETVEADKTGIEGLRELAVQNRLDREEWRRERIQMIEERQEDRRRLDDLEREVGLLRVESESYRTQIERMKSERKLRVKYIHVLIDFIKRLGHQPPEPEDPVVLQDTLI